MRLVDGLAEDVDVSLAEVNRGRNAEDEVVHLNLLSGCFKLQNNPRIVLSDPSFAPVFPGTVRLALQSVRQRHQSSRDRTG